MKFILPLPPGVNALYKITCRNGYPSMYKSAEGKAWIEEAGYKLKSQWKSRETLTNPLSLYILVSYKGRLDIDSVLKPLLDIFQTMNVIKNDSQITYLCVRKNKVTDGALEGVEVIMENDD